MTKKQPLNWFRDVWGGWHPDCHHCQEQYTISLVSALASVGIDQNRSTGDMAVAYFNDFHAKGHRAF